MELNSDQIAHYFMYFINGLPKEMQSHEVTLGNIVFFCINGLAIIGKLDEVLSPKRKKEIIDWIYSQQVPPPLLGGFRHSAAHYTPNRAVEEAHIVMTYSYLASLIVLGDDLSRVDVPRVMAFLKAMQLPSGSFTSHSMNSENDLRFVYSAAAICRILGTNGDLDIEKAIEFILSCRTYEGGFAYQHGDESHGGATFCAISALDLWGALDRIENKKLLAFWMSQRQIDGFNGRSHKLTDTCYSYWIGSPLRTLGWYDDIVDIKRLTTFIFSNYCGKGQFRSCADANPDIVHTYFSVCGLSLAGYTGVESLHPSLGIVEKYIPEKMKKLHSPPSK